MVNECVSTLLHGIDDMHQNEAVEKNNAFKKLQNISLQNEKEILQSIFLTHTDDMLQELQDVYEKKDDELVEFTYEALVTEVFQKLNVITTYINPLDWDMDYSSYEISLHDYNSEMFIVFATCEQYALDTVVDFLEEQGLKGYFLNEDEIESEDYVIRAGNHSIPIDGEHFHVKQLESSLNLQ